MYVVGRSFTVNNTHPGIHPLCTSGINHAVIPTAITMMNTSLKDERNGRKSSVRMRPDAGIVRFNMLRCFNICMVQKQKRINLIYP